MQLDDSYTDDMIVCKYGRSHNLFERLNEHKKTFKSINNANPMLKLYTYVDANYVSKAETQVKKLFVASNKIITYEKFDELVIIDKKFMEFTKDQYYLIGSNYVGTQHDTIAQIKDIENMHEKEILNLKHTIENNNIKYKLELSELRNERDMAIKDKEIAELKLLLANKQVK